MLYVKGMARMAIYAGMASVGSLKLMPVTAVNMRKPTMMRAGAVAKAELPGRRGKGTGEGKENGYGDGGKTGPSAFRNASRTFYEGGRGGNADARADGGGDSVSHESAFDAGQLPSSSSMFALEETPTRVPRVSKISTKRNAKRTTKKSGLITFEKSSCMKMGTGLQG